MIITEEKKNEIIKLLDDSNNKFIKKGTVQNVEITGEEGGVYYGNVKLLMQ